MNKKEIDSLDSRLNELYKNDITLNCIKQYEEDRKKLLALNSGDTISSELENLKKSGKTFWKKVNGNLVLFAVIDKTNSKSLTKYRKNSLPL